MKKLIAPELIAPTPAAAAEITVCVLAGGKSRRMGQNKALLVYQGQSFLHRLTAELGQGFSVVISCAAAGDYPDYPYPKYADLYPDAGAAGGLYTALTHSPTDAVLLVSCDTPLVSLALARHICSYYSGDFDAFVPVAPDGSVCPTLALYRKSALAVFANMLRQGRYSFTDSLAGLRVKYLSLAVTTFPEVMLQSVNTPEQYEALLRKDVDGLVDSAAGRG